MRFDVPDIRQKKLNACADVCFNVLLAHHGLPHTTAGTNDRGAFQGLTSDALITKLEQAGLQAQVLGPAQDKAVTPAELEHWLGLYGPLICSSDDHAFVVNGVQGDQVSIHCPLLGPRVGSIEALNKYVDWQDPSSIIATVPTGEASGADATVSKQSRVGKLGHQVGIKLLQKMETRATPGWSKPGDPV